MGVKYTYDPFDRLVKRELDTTAPLLFTDSTFEYFVYDGADVALAFDGGGSLTTRYLNGPAIDQILAEESVDGSGDPIDTRYMLADHQGSIRDVTNDSGTVTDHIFYDSYGNADGDDPGVQNTYGYAGYFVDTATGLVRSWGRWYDPKTGRWMGEDPKKDGTNWSIYVENSPTNYVDPTGLAGWRTYFGWAISPGVMLGQRVAEDIADRFQYEFITRHENEQAEPPPEPTGPPTILGSEPEAAPPEPCPVVEERPLRAGSVPDGDDRRHEFGQQLESDANNAAEFTADTLGGSVEAQRQLFSGKSITGRPLSEGEQGVAAASMGAPFFGKFAGWLFGRLRGILGFADEVAECADDVAKVATKPPRNAHLAGGKHPVTGIPFDKHGYPDFSGVSIKDVKIGQTGNRYVDEGAANKEAGYFGTPKGYTWHHHQDGTTMQLVPTDIHKATGHTGGVALGK